MMSEVGLRNEAGVRTRGSSLKRTHTLRFKADFVHERVLGSGSFGRVELVRHTVDGRKYAVTQACPGVCNY